MTMLSEALTYAERGWWVFPCREKPGVPFEREGEMITPTEKQPYIAKGLNDATIDKDQITAWWSKWPNALIGVNAGKSGLFVVDIDRKHVNGLDTYTQWDVNDSAGLHSVTPSGGAHIVFTGSGKSSSNAKTGIDTRGDGGYFIAPPSKILEGEHPGEYKRYNDWSKTPGVIPDGLLGKLFPDKTTEYVRGNSTSPIGQVKQLSRGTLTFLANGAEKGERNATLFKVLADFSGCGYSKEHARDAVMPVCDRMQFSKSEFEQVLTHAYSKARTASIPDAIQEKIMNDGKASITTEEHAFLEDAVLAGMMMDNSLIPFVQDILNVEDFRILKNRIIYKSINRIYGKSLKVDYVAVSEEVRRESDKITIDDLANAINEYYINIDNLTLYAGIIKERASLRKIEALMDNKDRYLKMPNFFDAVSMLEKDISDIALYGGAKSKSILDAFQATNMVVEQTRKITSGEISELKTGFIDYDNEVGGLYDFELLVVAGRPGDGKSALALSIANNVALVQNKPVAFFSLEMSTHETICRLVCQITGIPFKKVFRGKMNEGEWKLYKSAMEQISDSKMYFDDGFGMTAPEIRSKIRLMESKNLGLIVIDQLEQMGGFENQPKYIQMDNNAYAVKNLTKEFNIPILLNHQMNRSSTDRKLKNVELQLTDLNQAGEKPANQVWFISHKRDDNKVIQQSKISVMKNRNGPTMEFAVRFLGERMLFANPSREEERRVFTNAHEDEEHNDHAFIPEWAKE